MANGAYKDWISSEVPAASTLDGSELFALIQGGDTVKADLDTIAAYIGGGATGDVVGPASATDNAVARFDTTTGKLLQNSVVLIGDTGNITGIGTMASGAHTVTSTSATSFVVGPNGATNPAFVVDGSVASAATGFTVIGRAAGAGVTLSVISSGTNEGFNLATKGTGTATMTGGSSAQIAVSTGSCMSASTTALVFTNPARNATSNVGFTYNQVASGTGGNAYPASTEVNGVLFNMSTIQTHATGALTLQRDMRVRGSTHAFAGASTLTDAAAFSVDGAPIAGTNASITNSSAFHSPGVAVGSGVTNSYGINVTANTGATNNYIMSLTGSAGEVMNVRTDGKIRLLATNTTGGTTGDQTINRPSGTVNIAAAGTSITVTNSLCTTSSLVFGEVRTNDTTAKIKNIVPGSGSFVVTMDAAVTAETSIGFLIIN